ncbi:hypothetical protein J2W42_004067 [Rhizobium tibeticum]|uniref:hypothetical protein n=1 Tax=Rhizobium tibeticum TaxID=501024 RepID=UPI00277EA824|nr:hypothetical protein [Rhizobium tibeticum]MDP9811204.1 hypothetical protein [Rhizobium tibeticum]
MKAFLLTTLHVIRDGVVARTLAIGLPPSAASDSRKGPEGAVAVLVILIGRVAVRLHRHCHHRPFRQGYSFRGVVAGSRQSNQVPRSSGIIAASVVAL